MTADGVILRKTTGLGLLILTVAALLHVIPVRADDVPIQVTRNGFARRDLGDMIRAGLRQLEGDTDGFMAFYLARQSVGACRPLREGTIKVLIDAHDKQGMHFACMSLMVGRANSKALWKTVSASNDTTAGSKYSVRQPRAAPSTG